MTRGCQKRQAHTAWAAAAGRDARVTEVWHAARVSIGGSRDEAIRGARTAMASVAHHALRLDPAARGVPAELVPAIEELNARYRSSEHAVPGDNHNERLVEELGLMPYLLDRYALAGTPIQCAARLSELAAAGIERLLLMFAGADLEAQIRRWSREVLPLTGIRARGA